MSGSRAFILEPRALDEAQLTSALDAYDDLVADESIHTCRRIYDTFDWRIQHHGLLLDADEIRGSWRVTLRSAESGAVEATLVLGSIPRFGRDLPPSPLRSRLLPIIGVRALLERAEIGVTLRRYRRLNADDKTVSRLSIEDASLERHGRGDLDLGLRLRVEAVRGYDGATSKLAERLTTDLDLVDRPERLARDALLAAGHHPDEAVVSAIHLEAGDPADFALARVLRSQLDVVLANEPGVVADIDTECLHDLRVALRRSRSLLKVAGRVYPTYLLEPHSVAFRQLGSSTGPLRDLDVYLLDFDDIAAHVPEKYRDDLEPLRDLLESERRVEHQRVMAVLESASHPRSLDDWGAFLARAGVDGTHGRASTIGGVAAAAIGRCHRRFIRQGRSIQRSSPAGEIHTLRKRGKELRYLVDSFASLYDTDVVEGVTRPLKRIQDVLGAFQDGEVQVQAIERFARMMDERRCGSSGALLAMGLLRAGFEETHEAARADVRRSFEAFDRSDVTKRVRRLTRGS